MRDSQGKGEQRIHCLFPGERAFADEFGDAAGNASASTVFIYHQHRQRKWQILQGPFTKDEL